MVSAPQERQPTQPRPLIEVRGQAEVRQRSCRGQRSVCRAVRVNKELPTHQEGRGGNPRPEGHMRPHNRSSKRQMKKVVSVIG